MAPVKTVLTKSILLIRCHMVDDGTFSSFRCRDEQLETFPPFGTSTPVFFWSNKSKSTSNHVPFATHTHTHSHEQIVRTLARRRTVCYVCLSCKSMIHSVDGSTAACSAGSAVTGEEFIKLHYYRYAMRFLVVFLLFFLPFCADGEKFCDF